MLTSLVVGLIAGFLADKVVKNTYGLIGDLIVGIIGSFVGGWLFNLLDWSFEGLLGQIFSAFVGAVVLLLVLNAIKRKK